jgi:hypothetical protein
MDLLFSVRHDPKIPPENNLNVWGFKIDVLFIGS